jgi:hypothetical protein
MVQVFRRLVLVAAVVAVVGAGQAAQAGSSYTLQELLDGQSLVVGDKVFTNFRNFIGIGGAPSASNITVTGQIGTGGFVELFFTSAGWFVSSGQFMDTSFAFDVLVAAPNAIKRVEAALLASSTSGTGQINFDESIYEYDPSTFPTNLIGDIGLTKPAGPTAGGLDLKPFRTKLTIYKDLALIGGPNGFASISVLGQRFIQTVVPEPSSVVLMGLGVTLMAGYAWRRRGR